MRKPEQTGAAGLANSIPTQDKGALWTRFL